MALSTAWNVTQTHAELLADGAVVASAPRVASPDTVEHLTDSAWRLRLLRARIFEGSLSAMPDLRRAVSEVVETIGEQLMTVGAPGPIRAELLNLLDTAVDHQHVLQLGISLPRGVDAVTGLRLHDLPWEAAIPGEEMTPFSLHPHVQFYRSGVGPVEMRTHRRSTGPIRLTLALAQPIQEERVVPLDVDAELLSIVQAVAFPGSRAVVHGINPSKEGIRAALKVGDPDVLHLSSHGHRSAIGLESWGGGSEVVTAAELRDAIGDAAVGRAIVISSCLSAADPDDETQENDPSETSLALSLIDAGASAVVAMRDSVTDVFATALLAETYARIAAGSSTSLLAAFCAARREVAREAEGASAGMPDDWAIPVIYLSQHVDYSDAGESEEWRRLSSGVHPGDFLESRAGPYVARPGVERALHNFLLGQDGDTVCVYYGAAGAGKTRTVRSALAMRSGLLSYFHAMEGAGGVDELLSGFAAVLRQPDELLPREHTELAATIALQLDDQSIPWRQRLDALLTFSSDGEPGRVVLVWDGFESNLRIERHAADIGYHTLQAAELEEAIEKVVAARHPAIRLVLISRYFFLASDIETPFVGGINVGSLSFAKTDRLFRWLVRDDAPVSMLMRPFWQAIGGNPRGVVLFAQAINANESDFDRQLIEAHISRVIAALSEEAALDRLMGLLTPIQLRGLILASVFRRPVSYRALSVASNEDGDVDDERMPLFRKLGDMSFEDTSGRWDVDWSEKDLDPELRAFLPSALEAYPWLRLTVEGTAQVFLSLMGVGLLAVDNDLPVNEAIGHRVLVPRWVAKIVADKYPSEVQRAHAIALNYWMTDGRLSAVERAALAATDFVDQ